MIVTKTTRAASPRFARSLRPLIVLLLLPSVHRAEEPEWLVCAPRFSTVSRCEFSTSAAVGGETPRTTQHQLDVYRASREKGGVVTVVVRETSTTPATGSAVRQPAPVFFLGVDAHGKGAAATAAVLRRDPGLRDFLRDELAFAPGLEPLVPGHEWTGRDRTRHSLIFESFEVRHRVEAAGKLLRVESHLPEPVEFVRGRGRRERRATLEHWTRTVTVDPTDRTIHAVELELRAKGSRQKRVATRSFRWTRRSERSLSAAELTALEAEAPLLMTVEQAVQDQHLGYRRQGVLSTLFGARRREPRDPKALLAAYRERYPAGLLVSVVEPLRGAIDTHLDRLQRDRQRRHRGAALVGKAAPDFTLEGVDGGKVSLADYRGKVVLLTFWGYG